MVRKIFQILLISLSISYANDATTLYNDLKGAYGSKDNINNNINKPTTGSANFKTVDNSQTFSAPIECPSQAKAITITFNSSAGDYTASIKVDTDLNGTFDYFYTTPNISGVCTNGIVSCSPGTWNNCKYYYWQAPNKKPKLIETVDTSKTGTCSCANVSCGITTLDQPLFSMIGGGISQAIMKVNSRFLISKSKWNGNTLELYGQDTQNCANPNFNSYGNNNPTQYYNSQTYPNTDIATVAVQQSNDDTSPYSIVSQTSSLEYEQGKQIGMPSIQECTVRNVISNNVSTEYENCQTISWQGQQWCIVDRATSGGCTSGSVSINTPLDVALKPTQSLVAIFTGSHSICDDDSTTGYLNYTGDFTGNYTFGCELRNGKVVYIANSVNKNKNVTINLFKQVHSGGSSDCDFYDIKLLKSSTYTQDNFSVSSTNTCPSDCKLINEWVCDKDGNNCVQTVRDGNPLIVSLQKQCFNYTTSLSTYVICSDGNNITVSNPYTGQKIIGSGWFYVKRKYNCGTQTLDVDLSRTKSVVENTTSNNQTISYTDVDGTKDSNSFNINVNTCPNPVCTVKVPAKDTQAFSDDTNRSQTNAGTDTNELEVRVCDVDTNGNKTCPLNTGETLVENCKCDIGEQKAGFQTAVTSLQVLNEASKDMICSSSPP